MLRPLFILLLLVSCSVTTLYSQNKKRQKPINEIAIFYSYSFSRTFFEESIKERSQSFSGLSFVDDYYKSSPPSKMLIGYNFGIEYGRVFSKNNSLHLGVRYTLKGQRSSHFFDFYGRVPGSYASGYGGANYELTYTSNELYVLYGKRYNNKVVEYLWKFGLSADIYDNLFIKDYIIERNSGVKQRGCCTQFSYRYDDTYLSRLKHNLINGHIRLGIIISNKVRFKISDYFALGIGAEIQYLTKLLGGEDKINLSLTDGTAFLANIQLAINIKF